jgi:hypothetical protein
MTWMVGGGTDNGDPVSLVSTKTFAIRRREKDWSRESRPASWAATCCNRRRTASDSRTQVSRFWLGMAGCLSHFYCRSQEIAPDSVPVDEKLKSICTISVHDDPEWTEYQSWLPD